MSWTLPFTQNNFLPVNIKGDDSITATYGSVSILNHGKTELQGNTVITTRLGVGQNVDASYSIATNGIVNASDFYKNGVPFSGGGGNAFEYTEINTNNRTLLASEAGYIGINPVAGLDTIYLPNTASADIVGVSYTFMYVGTYLNEVDIVAQSGQTIWTLGTGDPSIPILDRQCIILTCIKYGTGVSWSVSLYQPNYSTFVENNIGTTFDSATPYVFNSNTTFSTGKVITLNSNILANTKTITPTELSYLDNLSENIQTKFTNLSNIAYNAGTSTTTLSSTNTNISGTLSSTNTNISGTLTTPTITSANGVSVKLLTTTSNTVSVASEVLSFTAANPEATFQSFKITFFGTGFTISQINWNSILNMPLNSEWTFVLQNSTDAYIVLKNNIVSNTGSTYIHCIYPFDVKIRNNYNNGVMTIRRYEGSEIIVNCYEMANGVGGVIQSVLNLNNTWVGTNAFNTSLPTSTLTPSSGTQLVTKTYVDGLIPASLLGTNNSWTGTNAFNSSLPTSTLTPSSGTQLVTKTYVDGLIPASLLGTNNSWTGTNAFNTSLPTSTQTPSSGTQLVTKTYVDGLIPASLLGTSNVWTNQNLYNSNANFIFQSNGVYTTIANQYFDTPAKGLNSYSYYAYPYSAITGWTFSNPANPVQIVIGDGFTDYCNLYVTSFPLYPTATQYIAFQFGNYLATTITMSQSITFTQSETTDYLLSFYTFGVYNRYVSTNTIAASINGYSTTSITVESSFSRTELRFRVAGTGGANTLTFTATDNSLLNSAITLYGVGIRKMIGVNVNDTTVPNSQLLSSTGLVSTNIFNQGDFYQYGKQKIFGSLEIYAPYSTGTTIIGNSGFGSVATQTGKQNVAIGVNALGTAGSTANINNCVAVGSGALEQIQNGNDCIAFGYRAGRYINGTSNYFMGLQAGEALGGGGTNNNYNIAFGRASLNRYSSSNLQYNLVIGHYSMGGGIFQSNIQYNTVVGHSSGGNITGSNNTVLGYNSAANMINTASSNNIFIGSNVCPTQSGSTNVMSNCIFIGSNSDVLLASNYTNSTCIGYGSQIVGSNMIFLGTSSTQTTCVGGLLLPFGEVLDLYANINTYYGVSSSATITPEQLSFLANVSAGQIPASTISGTFGQSQITNGYVDLTSNQTVAGIKTFSSPPVMSGASITASSIPTSAISGYATGFVTTTTDQVIDGYKTFVNPVQIQQYIPASTNVNLIITKAFTITWPVYEYYSLWSAAGGTAFTVTLPLVDADNELGATIRLRKVGAAGTGTTIAHVIAPTSPNTLLNTTNTAGNITWNYAGTIAFTSMETLGTSQTYTMSLSALTATIPAITTLTGTASSANIFPTYVTSQFCSVSGTTLTLSSANANIAVGMVIGGANMPQGTVATHIVSGSGLTWTINISLTAAGATRYFYSSYLKTTGTVGSVPNMITQASSGDVAVADFISNTNRTLGMCRCNNITYANNGGISGSPQIFSTTPFMEPSATSTSYIFYKALRINTRFMISNAEVSDGVFMTLAFATTGVPSGVLTKSATLSNQSITIYPMVFNWYQTQ